MKRIAAVITAAGFSRRFGRDRKLHATLDGRPVLAWTLATMAALPLAQRVVVVAPEDGIATALAHDSGAAVHVNPAPECGLGESIACGVRALAPGIDGVLVVLGDMPRVTATSCAALIEHFAPLAETAIVAPVYRGQRGHPVLFGAAHLPALAALTGDRGARALLADAAVTTIEVDDPGILLDIDTPADLAAAGQRRAAP
ncbi:MAG: nucleotidyltransferase family protein [Gammaproteobacteria bacterium]|nr:nucleotidyltransferase family protein [Gammaproteobacteria bacterium]